MLSFKQFLTENDRYKGIAGKLLAKYRRVYVHKDYADRVIPHKILDNATQYVPKDFPYNCIMWDMPSNTIRFDYSPDFDTAREPIATESYAVTTDGKVTKGKGTNGQIWHHKWTWVGDDYNGFDVKASEEWSNTWKRVLAPYFKADKLLINKIGRKNNWLSLLDMAGLKSKPEAGTI